MSGFGGRLLLEVSVFVFPKGLKNDGDDRHQRLDHAELESGLREQERTVTDGGGQITTRKGR